MRPRGPRRRCSSRARLFSPRSHSPNLSSPPPDVFAASIAVPVVLGCFLIWLVAFCVGRERRRARLAAAFGPVPVGGGAGIGAGVDTAGGAEARVSAGIGEVRFDNVVVVAGAGGRGKTPSRRLLDGVSGTCRRGELLGLLGPSGAGKSTLLNAVAGRVDLVRGMRQTAASSLWTTFRRGPGARPGRSPTYPSTTPTCHRTSPCSRR